MDKGTKQEIKHILHLFPGLRNDDAFRVTSPCDYDYNCIAWALSMNDSVKWPFPKEYDILDGVEYWPDTLPRDESPETFVAMFMLHGFTVCDSMEVEKGFMKLVLYSNPISGLATHATRQLPNGLWASKLRQLNDIQHSSPYSLEGDVYGRVCCVLKKEITFA